ncbi:MAG: hypothetical protein LBJ57_03650 [Prevotellaceae bacterium]|jgi:hypothetical protein|nr:hypothetical protein [Prevotellaceae bacterium]
MRTAKHKAYRQWLFALAMMLTAGASVNAQISVGNFEEDPTDQEARLGSPRRNWNTDELYALIKIRTSLRCPDFIAFDFGAMGMGEVDCKDGHTWVYAPAGVRRISISHKLAGSLENHMLPTPLRAGTVYVMELVGGTQRSYLEQTSNIGHVAFEGYPEGAILKINDEEEILTGKRWVKNLPSGYYVYEISVSGYFSERGKVTVKGDETKEISIKMVPFADDRPRLRESNGK